MWYYSALCTHVEVSITVRSLQSHQLSRRVARTTEMLLLLFLQRITDDIVAATGLAPEFLGTINNLTTSKGRDASFACSVRNLGGYRVRFW